MGHAKASYAQRLETLGKQKKVLERKSFLFYILRIVTFAMLVALVILLISIGANWPTLASMALTFFFFVYLIKSHLSIAKHLRQLGYRMEVNRAEVRSISHHLEGFNTGETYNYLNPELSADFDLFGEGSLFQYINRSSTSIGRKRFAEMLCSWDKEEDLITFKQQAIKELASNMVFVEEFQTQGKVVEEVGNEVERLLEWVESPGWIGQGFKVLLRAYPLAVFLTIMAVALSMASYILILVPVFFSLFLLNRHKRRIDDAHEKLGRSSKIFKRYSALMHTIEEESFKTKYLISLKGAYVQNQEVASKSLRKLFGLLEWFDIRFNVTASFLLNVLFLFDFQILHALELWKSKHRCCVPLWFQAISETDALIGLARFAFNNQEAAVYPKIQFEPFCLKGHGLGHPLIPHEQRVNNNLELTGSPMLQVVTGANMAGKSTYLRTLVVNLILAHNGAPVCAQSFMFSPCSIVSSINIRDSLAQNQSYFYAELLRIRSIIDRVEKNPRTLVVLDEILRGTNTNDKQLGTLGLLRKLIGLNGFTIIATHDLLIGKMAEEFPEIVRNHCFEVELENDELVFDYKLKEGVTTKLNASFLMRIMGVID